MAIYLCGIYIIRKTNAYMYIYVRIYQVKNIKIYCSNYYKRSSESSVITFISKEGADAFIYNQYYINSLRIKIFCLLYIYTCGFIIAIELYDTSFYQL